MSETLIEDNLQVVAFCLRDGRGGRKEDYGVSIEQVREIRPLESVTKVPNAKRFVRGVMNLRGTIIPVIDMKEKLGLGLGELNPKARILVSEANGKLVGLLIDEVDQVMRIPLKEVETHLSGGFESLEYIKGVAKTSGRLIVLLDIVKLLDDGSADAIKGV
ncbi:MAG: purine-binding chemotaxis protein CheW [Thaumarchaeota archaeon]|nr:purine-binding chemotaxis protein CheW [Nitrososphaerota archaeon]